jgi:predicted nucleic acid-binding protein
MATVPMVDTNVLIYAMRKGKTDDKPDLRTMLTVSTDLVRRLDKIGISAITHVEVMRALRPAEKANSSVQALFRRLHIMPFTAAAAERPVELLAQKNMNEKGRRMRDQLEDLDIPPPYGLALVLLVQRSLERRPPQACRDAGVEILFPRCSA